MKRTGPQQSSLSNQNHTISHIQQITNRSKHKSREHCRRYTTLAMLLPKGAVTRVQCCSSQASTYKQAKSQYVHLNNQAVLVPKALYTWLARRCLLSGLCRQARVTSLLSWSTAQIPKYMLLKARQKLLMPLLNFRPLQTSESDCTDRQGVHAAQCRADAA